MDAETLKARVLSLGPVGNAIGRTIRPALDAEGVIANMRDPTPRELVAWPVSIATLFGCGAFILRRRLLAIGFNRRVVWTIWVAFGVMVGRVVGLFVPIAPTMHIMRDYGAELRAASRRRRCAERGQRA